MNLIQCMREDLGVSRAEFSRRYNIPRRTLESWEWGDRECPEYVLDLLGRAVYSDITESKASFKVVSDEEDYQTDSYMKAVEAAKTITGAKIEANEVNVSF